MNLETAKKEAKTIRKLLEQGNSVFLASIKHPHRWVLEQLFSLLEPKADLKKIEIMSDQNLLEEFPVYQLEKVLILPQRKIYRYRFSLRK